MKQTSGPKKHGNPRGGKRGQQARSSGNNGKKGGLSGSSFFTWFMVIALLGVWTSVAVVWFELVDYEDVLAKAKDFRYNLSEVLQGKLDAYDTDGDGDFDIEDAKVLLDLSRSPLKTKTKEEVKEGIKEKLKRVKDKYIAPLKEKSHKEPKEKDQKHREVDKPKRDADNGKKDQEKTEPRKKKDDQPKEITKRTTSGRISSDNCDKNDKKADKQ
ncbi:aspartyl/asparaginyl beta-hydroxylase isoform X12 [Lithobates pipiens]